VKRNLCVISAFRGLVLVFSSRRKGIRRQLNHAKKVSPRIVRWYSIRVGPTVRLLRPKTRARLPCPEVLVFFLKLLKGF
jgi:hypothetical protein